jgi:RHS repeat-associated protein
MLTDGMGKTYVWDCENRLIQVDLPNNEIVKYCYDGASRRVKREHITPTLDDTTTYLYDGWNVLHESNQKSQISNEQITTTTNEAKSYVWGLDLSDSLQGAGGVGGLLLTKDALAASINLCHHLYDANGNTSELFDSNGATVAHYEYDAFGNGIVVFGDYASSNAYRFSTKPFDAQTAFDYYGVRFYQSSNGRWMNRDPLEDRGGMNLYVLVANDPVSKIDYLVGLEKPIGSLTINKL